MMKMHGLGDGAYWLVTYTWFYALYVLYMIVFIVFGSLIRLNMFIKNNIGVQVGPGAVGACACMRVAARKIAGLRASWAHVWSCCWLCAIQKPRGASRHNTAASSPLRPARCPPDCLPSTLPPCLTLPTPAPAPTKTSRSSCTPSLATT